MSQKRCHHLVQELNTNLDYLLKNQKLKPTSYQYLSKKISKHISNENELEKIRKTMRVIGGLSVKESNLYPWQVAMTYNGSHWCGGTIIDSEWVITASHCVTSDNGNNLSLNSLKIYTGKNRYNYRNDPYTTISKIIVHPGFITSNGIGNDQINNFTEPLSNDIALLKLQTPLNFDHTINNIELLSKQIDSINPPYHYAEQKTNTVYSSYLNHNIDIGNWVTITGWGLAGSSYDTASYPEHTHHVQTRIIPNEQCPLLNNNSSFCDELNNAMILAGDVIDGGEDGCVGDSGGPLVIYLNNKVSCQSKAPYDLNPLCFNNDVDCELELTQEQLNCLNESKPYLVGITSWGWDCGSLEYPGVWTRVSYYQDWIQKETGITFFGECNLLDACNYQANPAVIDNNTCLYLDECEVCGGDNSTCTGCSDPNACNYQENIKFHNQEKCIYANQGNLLHRDCNGNCIFSELTLIMSDDWGDGWEGTKLNIAGVNYTLEDEHTGIEFICSCSNEPIEIYWSHEGPYSSEISFEIIGFNSEIVLAGDINTCKNEKCTLPIEPCCQCEEGTRVCSQEGVIYPSECHLDCYNKNLDPFSKIQENTCINKWEYISTTNFNHTIIIKKDLLLEDKIIDELPIQIGVKSNYVSGKGIYKGEDMSFPVYGNISVDIITNALKEQDTMGFFYIDSKGNEHSIKSLTYKNITLDSEKEVQGDLTYKTNTITEISQISTQELPKECLGDLNKDGVVDLKDLFQVIINYKNPYTIIDLINVITNYKKVC